MNYTVAFLIGCGREMLAAGRGDKSGAVSERSRSCYLLKLMYTGLIRDGKKEIPVNCRTIGCGLCDSTGPAKKDYRSHSRRVF
jgi:hypothetical protein